jgi:hypothetical protein
MAAQNRWLAGSFGDPIQDVRSVVVHQTAGWPSHAPADSFVDRYITPGTDKRGIGTQYYISADGTAFGLIDLPLLTLHATFVNGWAIGVETGLAGSNISPARSRRWRALSNATDDVPGAKAYVTVHPTRAPHNVVVSWFGTSNYTGPAKEAGEAHGQMLFTERQYRTWACLARYLAEELGLPRNFPLLPYENRSDNITDAGRFRRIVLADDRFEMIVRALTAFQVDERDFDPANLAALTADYDATVLAALNKRARHNRMWLAFFNAYRGFHGHGFSGSITRKLKDGVFVNSDHDCPGPLFDWYRFARETWDWWWYPFDFNDAQTSTAVPFRGYRAARRETPLIEYYFDEDRSSRINRITVGIGGVTSSPNTFRLDPASPIYALANGDLVAARFPDISDGVSMAFVLTRHEVYHRANPAIPVAGAPAAHADRIDYDVEPSYVYSLVMHLGRPSGMSFENIVDANPDWLNRLLTRLKECRLGTAYHPGAPVIPDSAWNARPPGAVQRPSVLESWRFDQDHALGPFLNDLSGGFVALAPGLSDTSATPIRIILGDFLGVAGTIRREGAAATQGIRVEVFSPDLISAADFAASLTTSGWPAGQVTQLPPAVLYPSEWSRTPAGQERRDLEALGVDTAFVNWWSAVAAAQAGDLAIPAAARLPVHATVWHYQPLDFLRWLNDITWRSEWPKYNVMDAQNAPQPRPSRPRTRRV